MYERMEIFEGKGKKIERKVLSGIFFVAKQGPTKFLQLFSLRVRREVK